MANRGKVCKSKMSENTKFSSYLNCCVYENSEIMCLSLWRIELILEKKIFNANFLVPKSGQRLRWFNSTWKRGNYSCCLESFFEHNVGLELEIFAEQGTSYSVWSMGRGSKCTDGDDRLEGGPLHLPPGEPSWCSVRITLQASKGRWCSLLLLFTDSCSPYTVLFLILGGRGPITGAYKVKWVVEFVKEWNLTHFAYNYACEITLRCSGGASLSEIVCDVSPAVVLSIMKT